MLKLRQLLNKVEPSIAKAYLRQYFEKPEHITDFAYLFDNHVFTKLPLFHQEMLNLFTGGGRIAIAAPRGFAKSTTTNVVGASWFACTGHYRFILLISDTYTQATLQLRALKAELEANELLNFIYPGLKGDIWADDTITINSPKGQVMIMALGAGMKIRGLKFMNNRPQLAIIDDLENMEAVYSAERRDKLERWFNYDLLPGLAKGSKNIIYLGTILHFHALLRKVVLKEGRYAGWTTRHYKALQADGTSLWPTIYPVEKLIAMRDNPQDPDFVGSLVFAQEYQNEPQDDTDRIIKSDWLNVRFKLAEQEHLFKQQNPETQDTWVNSYFKRRITGVDPAISEKETADNFARVTVGIAKDNGHIWILDVFKGKLGDPLEQVNLILDGYQTWRDDSIKIEAIAYQQGLYNLVRRIGAERNIYPPITPFKPDRDKIRRAHMVSSLFAGGLIHIREDMPFAQAFIDEILQFPMGEHDDMFDAFMNAVEECVVQNKPRVFAQKPSIFR